jgi:hypothetical protein
MTIETTIDRLRALQELRTVDSAAEYAALEAPPAAARCPAAYVIELADNAGENGLAAGAVRQRLTERLAVVLIVASLRDARGAAAAAELRRVRHAVRGALVGWAPDEDHDALTFLSGRLIAAERGYLVWQEEFTTRSLLRGP